MREPTLMVTRLLERGLPTSKALRYSSFGSYPLAYLVDDRDVLCPDCAAEAEDEGELESAFGFMNNEDPMLFCDGCSERIESAYAEE